MKHIDEHSYQSQQRAIKIQHKAFELSIVELRDIAAPLAALLMLVFLSCQPVRAERQSLASLKLQAEEFIAAYPYESPYPPQFQVTTLDRRLNLKACAAPLVIGFTHANKRMGNTSLSVACPAPVEWRVTLPVRISVFRDVIVNKSPLLKGQRIDESTVDYRKTDISRVNQGYFSQLEQLLELQSKRNLPSGSILGPNNLEARQVIKSGQQVTILFESPGLSIRGVGKALHSARHGEPIKVKNNRSARIIEGRVSGDGLVRVGL